MGGSNFVYHHINFLDIKFNQVDLISGGTYIKEDKWLTNKKQPLTLKIIKAMMFIVSCMQLLLHLIIIK